MWGSSTPWGNSSLWGGIFERYQFQVNMKTQWCSNIRVKISDSQTSNYTEGYTISGISFEIGQLPGSNRLPVSKKVGTQ